jgi:N-acetylglucosaminylphosphatidylinositol deacetylase
MSDWYQNTVLIFVILLIALVIPYIQKIKFNKMFEITNIDKDLSSVGSVLLLIAHPDDEIMFWTPTIKYFLSKNINLKILCLSNGNYNGLGELREIEFDNVSRELNLSNNIILNIPELQDDITKKWDSEKVSEILDDYLNKNNDIKTIITFDGNGVTKHPNHISCFEGLMFYLNKYNDECKKKNIRVFTLKSFNFMIQYSWLIPMI